MAIVELDRNVAAAGDLPPVCVHCGAPAVAYRRRSFSGRTPITLTAGLGFLRAKLPVCQLHLYYTRTRTGVLLGVVAVWVTLLFVLGSLDSKPGPPDFLAPLAPWRGALILACVAALGAVIVLRFATFYTDIRLYDANWTTMWLTGVSDGFAQAWQQRNARTWVDEVTGAAGTEPVDATPADDDGVVLLIDASGDGPVGDAGPSHVIPGKRRTVTQPPRPQPPPHSPMVGGVVGSPPGRGSLSTWLAVGIIGAGLCCGLPVAAWLGSSILDDTKVRIHSVRTSPVGTLGAHLQLSYRSRNVDPRATYVVVVRQADRVVVEHKLSGATLRQSAPVGFDVLSGPFGASGTVEVSIEEELVGGGRELASNVRTVELNE